MILASTCALAFTGVFIQGVPTVAISVRALTVARVVIQDLWAGAGRWWTRTPASLWINYQVPMTPYVPWTFAATREDVKIFMVVSFAF